jgi:hypothetical protein
MLISTALLLDSIIHNSVCTPAKLPCRRVEVGYEIIIINITIGIHGVPELAYQPLTVYFNICSKRDFATINIQTLVVFKLNPF